MLLRVEPNKSVVSTAKVCTVQQDIVERSMDEKVARSCNMFNVSGLQARQEDD